MTSKPIYHLQRYDLLMLVYTTVLAVRMNLSICLHGLLCVCKVLFTPLLRVLYSWRLPVLEAMGRHMGIWGRLPVQLGYGKRHGLLGHTASVAGPWWRVPVLEPWGRLPV